VVEGGAGDHAGSRMIAGTLIVARKAGELPGYLMKRGTIILGEGSSALAPTFADCGTHRLVAMRLMADFLKPYSARTAALLRGPLQRFAGDMAVLGKGEILIGNQS
jgi:formylmethanofuran dehydrogenase subunit C